MEIGIDSFASAMYGNHELSFSASANIIITLLTEYSIAAATGARLGRRRMRNMSLARVLH